MEQETVNIEASENDSEELNRVKMKRKYARAVFTRAYSKLMNTFVEEGDVRGALTVFKNKLG